MQLDQAKIIYATRLGDNALILGQRLIQLVAHGPELEEELACANIALDCIGQARMFYTCAADLEGRGRSEDDLAFLRDTGEFQNLLIVEQPNGHFGDTIVRQVLFDTCYLLQLEALLDCAEPRLAEIAARAVKEIRYHLRHVSQWLIRLGDGTELSRARVRQSLEEQWRFTGEMFEVDEVDEIMRDQCGGPDPERIRGAWRTAVKALLDEARLDMPADGFMASGGRRGVHTEQFGYLIAEMQHLQRAYPGAGW